MANPPPAPWWHRPEAYLYAWDFKADEARFLPLDRDALARSSFLDQRIAADLSTVRPAGISEVLAHPVGRPDRPPAFIFHTAFCCSTLLARSLDLPGQTLVLREPATLLQLADLKRGLAATERRLPALLAPTLNLLVRPFAPRERVLIKPTNLVNNLIPELLAACPGARVLILYDGLEAFLISVLKRPRESERGIAHFLDRLLRDPAARLFPGEVTGVSGLPRQAALAWALQRHALASWLDTRPGNVRILDTPRLLGEPLAALQAAAGWLDLGISGKSLQDVSAGPIWKQHAKHSGHGYTPTRRGEEQALARRVLAEPLRQATDWAAHVPGLIPQPLPPDLQLML